jgi:hypothetical protein
MIKKAHDLGNFNGIQTIPTQESFTKDTMLEKFHHSIESTKENQNFETEKSVIAFKYSLLKSVFINYTNT